jgi:4-amino-4-deoxy-L-arabinose transferase-like glycosyltransferase
MIGPAAEQGRAHGRLRRALIVVFLLGLGLRLIALWTTADLEPRIADEKQFVELAQSIVRGDGFAWDPNRPTSLRPPLFPGLVALTWAVTGEGNFQAVRAVQIILSFMTAVLLYDLGRRVFGASVGGLAASIAWLYPSLIFLNFTLLTETLFTLLVVAFILLSVMLVERPKNGTALACGLVLGLGALTRSVLWPMPIILCPVVAWLLPERFPRRLALAALVFAGYAAVVLPWAVRNTRLQGVVTIVDTMGGMNLRMGNYEHTPEDRMWDAVSLTGDKNWVYALTQEHHAEPITEGQKDKWAQQKAIAYMRANPATTARRGLIKFADFWGLERELIAGVQQGLYAPPRWFVAVAAVLILLSYAAVALLGGAGLWLSRPPWRVHVLLLLPILVITGVHTLVFGHSRYHIPLVPILALYAAALWQSDPGIAWRRRPLPAAGATLTVVVLAAVWLRQLIVVDGPRIRTFLDSIR